MRKQNVAKWSDLGAGGIAHAIVSNVDLVVIRWPDGEGHSVLYGRCVHRGSLMADGSLVGDDIACGVQNWDYRYETGVSAYKTSEKLHRFMSGVEDGQIWVDADDVEAWLTTHPQSYDRDSYQGAYQDHTGGPDEPHEAYIRELASNGLSGVGHHGAMGAIGFPFGQLPKWHDIQIVTAQPTAWHSRTGHSRPSGVSECGPGIPTTVPSVSPHSKNTSGSGCRSMRLHIGSPGTSAPRLN